MFAAQMALMVYTTHNTASSSRADNPAIVRRRAGNVSAAPRARCWAIDAQNSLLLSASAAPLALHRSLHSSLAALPVSCPFQLLKPRMLQQGSQGARRRAALAARPIQWLTCPPAQRSPTPSSQHSRLPCRGHMHRISLKEATLTLRGLNFAAPRALPRPPCAPASYTPSSSARNGRARIAEAPPLRRA